MRRAILALSPIVLFTASVARADQTIVLDGAVSQAGADHVRVPFEVPPGVAEIEVRHDDLSDDTILDFGLDDPSGFRGWGGGNTEPAVVNAVSASRSYLPGPMTAGTWNVVIGKAKLARDPAPYHVEIVLKDAPTLAAQDRRPFVLHPALTSVAGFYAGDFHVHSRESGDASAGFDEIVDYARGAGLDFVEISDHNTVSQLDFLGGVQERSPDVLLLRGMEYTTYAGHANVIGIASWLDHKLGQPGVVLADVVAAAHAQGALFSINHPALDIGDACIGCAWKHDLAPEAIDAVEVATGDAETLFGEAAIAFWDKVCDAGRHAVPIGGSDDHRAGRDLGAFGAPIGTPATYVFADALSESAILEGMRRGKTVVKVNGTEGPMVDLVPGRWESDVLRGESVRLNAVITGASGLEARWVKNGVRDATFRVTSDPMDVVREVVAPTGREDRYRIEIVEGGGVVTLTSHVWVTFEAGSPSGGACGVAIGRAVRGAAVPVGAAALIALAAAVRRRSRGKCLEKDR